MPSVARIGPIPAPVGKFLLPGCPTVIING